MKAPSLCRNHHRQGGLGCGRLLLHLQQLRLHRRFDWRPGALGVIVRVVAGTHRHWTTAWHRIAARGRVRQYHDAGGASQRSPPAQCDREDIVEFGYFTLSDKHYDDNTRSANQFVADITVDALYAD